MHGSHRKTMHMPVELFPSIKDLCPENLGNLSHRGFSQGDFIRDGEKGLPLSECALSQEVDNGLAIIWIRSVHDRGNGSASLVMQGFKGQFYEFQCIFL